ncbi:MAG: T9SS type A sorting domain-containing protein [Bacteroidetes bacterium]|nr:T9SS type A sorting domain-containing protein [Bacteroidota bacterium]
MKKIIFIFIIIQISNQVAEAQWIQQFQVTPTNHLFDVSFINDKTGWTCGNQGTIMKTTNSGKEWIRQTSGVYKNLYNIFAVNSQVVYCVGFFECILKTTNGGDNWIILRNSDKQSPSFEGLFFLNADTGWLTKNQYILRTTNGGNTFDSAFVDPSYIFDIYFKNYNEGLFCGEGAYMFKTSNAGINWNRINIVPNGQGLPDFFNLTFVNENTGYTQGSQNNSVYRTTNFGTTWDSITVVQGIDDSYCIKFSSLNTGWCAGTFGKMFKTINGGYNWSEVNLSMYNEAYINSLWFYNDYTGWAIGAATKILYTDNGGKTNVASENNLESSNFKLNQNYPNPFNSQTLIKYEIEYNSSVTLEIYDIRGKKLETLVNQSLNPGEYSVIWKSDYYSSGIYFYTLSNGNFSKTKQMILLK